MKEKKEKRKYLLLIFLICIATSMIAVEFSLITGKLDRFISKPFISFNTWKLRMDEGTIAPIIINRNPSVTDQEKRVVCDTIRAEDNKFEITNIQLYSIGDSCIYHLISRNEGLLNAKINKILTVDPENVICESEGSTMRCDNVVYTLTKDIDGKEPVKVDEVISKGETLDMYLTIRYELNKNIDENKIQKGAEYYLIFTQA